MEYVAISSFRRSSQLRDWTLTLESPVLAGRFLTTLPPGKPVILQMIFKRWLVVICITSHSYCFIFLFFTFLEIFKYIIYIWEWLIYTILQINYTSIKLRENKSMFLKNLSRENPIDFKECLQWSKKKKNKIFLIILNIMFPTNNRIYMWSTCNSTINYSHHAVHKPHRVYSILNWKSVHFDQHLPIFSISHSIATMNLLPVLCIWLL